MLTRVLTREQRLPRTLERTIGFYKANLGTGNLPYVDGPGQAKGC